jgi:hypothetical protein
VLKDGSTTLAGRFVGALQAVGRVDDEQHSCSRRWKPPVIACVSPIHSSRLAGPCGRPMESPYVQRIRLMWD